MRTDHFDLYQFHAVTTMEEVETIVGPGGALEAFVEAREQGLVRFLGSPPILKRRLWPSRTITPSTRFSSP